MYRWNKSNRIRSRVEHPFGIIKNLWGYRKVRYKGLEKNAAMRYRIAVGQGSGGRTLTLKNPALAGTDSTPKPLAANQNGFSLNCAVSCQAHQRDRLERLCRYITRPALCLERLSTNCAGQVVYQLKNPFRDGTTHIQFRPKDFVARLAGEGSSKSQPPHRRPGRARPRNHAATVTNRPPRR